MAAEVRYAPEAEEDIAEGYAWYDRSADGLGEEFLRAVEAGVAAIARSPNSGRTIHKTYRRAVVRRFPYVVIFEYDNGVVTAYSVFHTSQDPNKWRQRLP